MILDELTIYISNNINKFGNIAREQHWCPKEAIISVRDVFHVTYKGTKVFLGEINSLITFNTTSNEKDLEILNVSIDPDTFKIISPKNQDIAKEKLIEYTETFEKPATHKNINKIRNKVSIYYNMMLDISKTTNNKHYERFILELLRLIDNPTTIDSSITKKRRGSSF